MPRISFTGDEAADTLLSEDPFALLLGMLLDQQVAMEWAFAGPLRLQERLGHLDPARIAAIGGTFAARRVGVSDANSVNEMIPRNQV